MKVHKNDNTNNTCMYHIFLGDSRSDHEPEEAYISIYLYSRFIPVGYRIH